MSKSSNSGFKITDIAFDHTRNIALVAGQNRTIRVFNLSRHTVQGSLSLTDIRKKVITAEEIRNRSQVRAVLHTWPLWMECDT